MSERKSDNRTQICGQLGAHLYEIDSGAVQGRMEIGITYTYMLHACQSTYVSRGKTYKDTENLCHSAERLENIERLQEVIRCLRYVIYFSLLRVLRIGKLDTSL